MTGIIGGLGLLCLLAASPAPAVDIEAEGGVDIDLENRTLRGVDVTVRWAKVELCCPTLVAKLDADGATPNLRCEGGVGLWEQGEPLARAARATLNVKARTLTLNGRVAVSTVGQGGRLEGETVLYDVAARTVKARGRARWHPRGSLPQVPRCGSAR